MAGIITMPITQNVEGTPAAGMSAFTVITPAMANKSEPLLRTMP